MKRALFCMAAAAVSLAAQAPDNKPSERLFILKYADPQAVSNLVRIFGAEASPNSELHALAIRAHAEKWPAIEEAIHRLDVPSAAPKNIEVTVYFLVAGKDLQQGMPLGSEVEPVVTQLKKTFAFPEYRVLDTLMLRMRVGQIAEASGSLAPGRARAVAGEAKSMAPIVTQVKLRAAAVDPDGKIRIDNLRAGMRLPTVTDNKGSFTYIDTGINTDIDVKDGQKAVIGKSSFEGPDKAIFLVLAAKVLE